MKPGGRNRWKMRRAFTVRIRRFNRCRRSRGFSVLNEYFVNSEGTVTRTGRNAYSVQLSASTQAPDGMRLARSPAWTVAKYEELPTSEKLAGYSREALETLKALRNAPIVDEEYRGPVLFEADAADDVIEIGRASLGKEGRFR